MSATVPFNDLAAATRGRVVTPADSGWDATRQVFNLAVDVDPEAIALPLDAADVQAAVRYASANGLRVAAQATGHNAGAYATLEDTLLVDVRELQEITIDADARRVRVGAGVRWQSVVPRLSELGLAALHGSSPLVGIAGYSLGGGMGWLARKYGLQANSVTAIELVCADGELRRVDHENEPELFWALRGGNGNFGVVTALEFEVYPVAELYAGAMFFPLERADQVLRSWVETLPALSEEMMTWATILRFPDLPEVPEPMRGGEFIIVFGVFLGDEQAGVEELRPVRDLGPVLDTFAMVPPAVLGDLAMDPSEPLPYATNTALLSELPAAGIDELLSVAGAGSGSPLVMVQLRHLGGALGRVSPDAGARAKLDGEIAMFSLGVPENGASALAVQEGLDQVERALLPYGVGSYPNFVERPAEASSLFDAATWARLRHVKSLHDPMGLFVGNHRIAPAEE